VNTILAVVAMAALAFLIWGRTRDDLSSGGKAAKGLRWAGVAILAGYAVLFLVFGVGEMTAGDWSGAGHLVSVLAIGLLAYLAGRRPLVGGTVLLVMGVALSIMFAVGTSPDRVMSVSLLGAPPLLSGALLLASGLLARRKATTTD